MDFYIPHVPVWFNWSLTLAVLAAALWRGGGEERLVAGIVLFQAINDYVEPLRWTIGAPTDIASLAILTWLVLRSRRYWTIWAAASAVLSLVTHALYVYPGVGLWAYLSAEQAFSYLLRGSVLFGSLQRRPGRRNAHAH